MNHGTMLNLMSGSNGEPEERAYSVATPLEAAAEKLAEEWSDRLWDLKADLFQALKDEGVIERDAEGPDCEETIKLFLDEIWWRI